MNAYVLLEHSYDLEDADSTVRDVRVAAVNTPPQEVLDRMLANGIVLHANDEMYSYVYTLQVWSGYGEAQLQSYWIEDGRVTI